MVKFVSWCRFMPLYSPPCAPISFEEACERIVFRRYSGIIFKSSDYISIEEPRSVILIKHQDVIKFFDELLRFNLLDALSKSFFSLLVCKDLPIHNKQ